LWLLTLSNIYIHKQTVQNKTKQNKTTQSTYIWFKPCSKALLGMLTSHQILWNLEAHSCAYIGSPTVPNLTEITPLNAIPSNFFKVRLCLDLSSGLLPSSFATKTLYVPPSPPAPHTFLNLTNQTAPGDKQIAWSS
jgi:hypothetical protein